MPQRVFVDANVLYSKTCRDWLFLLRQDNEGMFQLHTTREVIVEVLANRRKQHPRAGSTLLETLLTQIECCMDELIESFPENFDFTGKDVHDYHVHAAAVASDADILLTDNNPEDFTADPDAEPYEIYSSDDFFMLVTNSNPDCTLTATEKQQAYWSDKAGSLPIDEALKLAGCPKFADRVSDCLAAIHGHSR